ncbi:MAG: OmpA family protein [Gemmatimonadetes bacterium]|nr:OmpA family protein [Gemmatimonadota bacterium]
MSEDLASLAADDEEFWQSVADLMSGLMIVFLFLAITYWAHSAKQRAQMREVAVVYEQSRRELYQELDRVFAEDLRAWNAEIDSVSLSVRFKEPDVLFEAGSATVRPRFQEILRSFFPRYVAIVRKYEADVEEVRIEGHTSSEGPGAQPYYYNMALSQDRTRAVLAFCLEESGLSADDAQWVRGLLTANGLSSSRLIRDSTTNLELRSRSRRVEFRVRTNAELRIATILEMSR